MTFLERLDNVYVIDTKMWGFDNYSSSFLVAGKEVALIDAGIANQKDALYDGIKAHGFSMSDISYVFVTHEHMDHAGNVAAVLRDSPRASVYINPIGETYLTNPSKNKDKWKEQYSPEMLARRPVMEPVPASRIKFVNDGDVFDLGNGEKLKIIYTPGHQPGGIVILEEKNMGLFINDLVGNCFPDADSHYPLNPFGSDSVQTIESLRKLMEIPAKYLYLGHYGICDNPQEVIARSINKIQKLVDIGTECIRAGKPELIADKVLETIMPELEKLRKVRGEAVYQYAAGEHMSFQAKLFAQYCQERLKI